MANTVKYIKDLEAVGFRRIQAEAQVQVILDMTQHLATKEDLVLMQDKLAHSFATIDSRFTLLNAQIRESELRIVNRLGFVVVTCTTIAVMILTWLKP